MNVNGLPAKLGKSSSSVKIKWQGIFDDKPEIFTAAIESHDKVSVSLFYHWYLKGVEMILHLASMGDPKRKTLEELISLLKELQGAGIIIDDLKKEFGFK